MAHIKSEPIDDSPQSTETEFIETKYQDNLQELTSGQEISAMVPFKSEPVLSPLKNGDGSGVVMKDLDQSESCNELDDPLFVAIKEEPSDGTLSDEQTLEGSDHAEGSMTVTSSSTGDVSNAWVMSVSSESPHSSRHCDSMVASTSEIKGTTDSEVSTIRYTTEEYEQKQLLEIRHEEHADGRDNMQSSENVVGIKVKRRPALLKTCVKPNKQIGMSKIPLNCQECGKTISHKHHLIAHMRLHTGDKPFQCSHCGMTFNQRGHLTTHMRQHTGEKPFKCSQCEKAFSRKDNLITHMRHHTGEKPFMCSQCGKSFSQKSSLNVHMVWHTGEKPFKCSQCGKAFNKTCNLTSHMRQHTGEKPYKCNQCGRAFNKRCNLVTHMRQHTGEKPFKCNRCGKAFKQSCNLRNHMRQHIDEKLNEDT